ncbi:MAG: nucleoside hydrolase [Planctomycetota bacterium]
MSRSVRLILLIALIFVPVAGAHDVGQHAAVVIDTDMGIDDAVTMALALQNPRVEIVAVVACEGVASPAAGVESLARMLDRFNRRDIPLYAPVVVDDRKAPPPFRGFAENAVRKALPNEVKYEAHTFSPAAYKADGRKTVVLVLGPLTNLAAALRQEPDLKDSIERIIVAGEPDPATSWNAGFDPQAVQSVQAAGIPLTFIAPGPGGRKPATWYTDGLSGTQNTSLAEAFFNQLLGDSQVHQHYFAQFESFHDELAFLYLQDASLFSQTEADGQILMPTNWQATVHLFTQLISTGRQYKHRVVFAVRPFPDNIFQPDVRARKEQIITKNGADEWFAQLLLNELHDHLGAYSIIGVKMGLRGAELLNAPQHTMLIVSHTPAEPPVSCFNDGLLVSTGCTPGRGLFKHEPGPPGTVQADFVYNGKRITLRLKSDYREKIKSEIQKLRRQYSLSDHEYWHGVRQFGLDIWENWHRRDIFELVE